MIHTGQFQSGLATTYGKNRTEIEDTWPRGMKLVSYERRREHSGTFVSGLSIRLWFLSVKETLTSSSEVKGKLCQRFQLRFSFSLFRRTGGFNDLK